jgi:hypothetical protein
VDSKLLTNGVRVPDDSYLSSPASHTSDASSLQPPPSPTLSAHSSSSVRWANSIVLRATTIPEEHDGLSSLGLLALRRRDIVGSQARQPSQVLVAALPTVIPKILPVLDSF